MKIWELSVRRPIFMSCVLVALMVIGFFSFKKTAVELFPDVAFPVVIVQTIYPGAGPEEVETLIAKPIEEELSTIAGVKNIRSINRESVGVVVAEFNLSVDVKWAEQQVRDKIASAKNKLPTDAKDPITRTVDPSAQPIVVLAIETEMKGKELFDLADNRVRPLFEQVDQVGRVEVIGGRKREIQVQLDKNKLEQRGLSVLAVAQAFKNSGMNLPAGKIDEAKSETVFRTLGEFNDLEKVRRQVVTFIGNDILTTVNDIGQVVDTVEDERVRAYLAGKETVFINVYKQSGANTVAVGDAIKKRVEKVNKDLKGEVQGKFEVKVVRDMSRFVWANVQDVGESILLGVILTIIVVFLFLGSMRSTIITGLAIPVSLVGCMPLLYLAGISINVMSMLAFSLAVGLLIDDAIVVRENIFRHLEMGKTPMRAALEGTAEVGMAVTAVTLAVLAVFAPIGFLSGVVGQFFKSFGLGVCCIMVVSLFDALSNAPMMSAYFGGKHEAFGEKAPRWKSPSFEGGFGSQMFWPLRAFFSWIYHKMRLGAFLMEKIQRWAENVYEGLLKVILIRPWLSIFVVVLSVFLLGFTVKFVPKTFLPPNDSGEFVVGLELKPGTTLDTMNGVALKIDQEIRKTPVVDTTTLTVGSRERGSYTADIYVKLLPFGQRKETTSQMKDVVREMLKKYAFAAPKVKDVDFVGAGQRPFVINIRGQNMEEIRAVGQELFKKLKAHPALVDPEITDKPGLPEFQVHVDNQKTHAYGVTPTLVGAELRARIEGDTSAKFRENGLEYDIRVRLRDDQRDLEKYYDTTSVPNLNQRLVAIKNFTTTTKLVGAAEINRENRGRYVSIEADVAAKGPGMGGAVSDINQWFESGEIKLPVGTSYRFVGQAENFQELGVSILIAGLLAIIFIYLVLASLYESLVTPFTIMLVIPLAIVGGFFGLFLFRSSLDLFSMIGCIMLMGLATKNSIILVDYINQKLEEGMDLKTAIIQGSKTRLRPILMTTFALIAGMIPVAIGLNEASSQRKALGIAVCSGVVVSTLLTLILIPAVFSSIERGRRWMIKNFGSKLISDQSEGGGHEPASGLHSAPPTH